MTRDDIIRLAKEAGLAFDSEEYPDIWQTYMYVGREEIERFAALVAAEKDNEIRRLREALKWARIIDCGHCSRGEVAPFLFRDLIEWADQANQEQAR